MSDPDYASVSLLLHGDGANGSTTFTDSSATPKTVTVYGDAQISTAQSKFGGASMAFDGAGDYLSVPASADFDFGPGDFTVEWFEYSTSDGNKGRFHLKGSILGDTGGEIVGLAVGYNTSNWTVYLGTTAWNASNNAGFGVAALTGQQVHVELSRGAGVVRLFINGTQLGNSISYTSALPGFSSPVLTIGAYYNTNFSHQGYLDEFRITKGVARHTANFTPPTAAFANQVTETATARAAAPTPLGAPAALATYGNNFYARAAAPGPLGTPATLVQLVQLVLAAHTAAPGPLAAPSLLAAALVAAYTAAPGPLGNPTALASMPLAGNAAAPSPLGSPAATAYHDFTGQLGDIVTRYTMNLITPTGTVRVPISSWQATLQTGSSNYVQCVIPACTMWVEAITTATEFVISRRATLPSGAAIELEMASAPADQAQFDQGPQRHTCTLSGYAEAFAEDLDPPVIYDRVLAGVRSISSGDSSLRVRCAIDWLLRPGHRAFVNGTPFLVGYINYYAPSGFDAYMDVGSRA